MVGKADAIFPRLPVHRLEIHRAELVDSGADVRLDVVMRRLPLAAEGAVWNVHGEKRDQVAACTAADHADAAGINAVFGRMPAQKADRVAHIQHRGWKYGFAAETVFDAAYHIAAAHTVQIGGHVTVALIAQRKAATVDMDDGWERTVSTVGIIEIQPLRCALGAIRHVQQFARDP